MENPARLVELFSSDPEVHLYGLADLEEPYWSRSEWWIDEGCAAGVVGFPDTDSVSVYAMSQRAPGPTLELAAELVTDLGAGTLVIGPIGLAEWIARKRPIEELGVHLRLISEVGPIISPVDVVDLAAADLDELAKLYDTDPGAAFYLPHMVRSGHFVGLRDGGRLVAAAGTHVVSKRFGVAAVGAVITDPQHRGRGLGRNVTKGLTARLQDRYPTIGLNVAEKNTAALHLYESIGFVRRFSYEEIQLL